MSKKTGDLLNKIVFDASAILEKKRIIIPTSPNIDIILGGGILDGTLTIITGPPKVGKTSTALNIARNAQKLGKTVYFVSVEGRLQKRDLRGIDGLDLSEDKFKIIMSHENKILDAHEFIEAAETILKVQKNVFMIFDSFSQLCPSSLRDHDMIEQYRDFTPSLLSWFTKRLSGILSLQDNCLIGILHRTANQDPKSRKKWVETGGNKMQYAYDNKLVATHQVPWVVNEYQIGQVVNWECQSTAIGTPNKKCESYFRYGYGIDDCTEIFSIARNIGVIKTAGSWYSYNDLKLQGGENFTQAMKDDKKLYSAIKKEVDELIT